MLGVWNVGYIMIVYGVADAICSFLFGRLVQYVGHIPFFVLGESLWRLLNNHVSPFPGHFRELVSQSSLDRHPPWRVVDAVVVRGRTDPED